MANDQSTPAKVLAVVGILIPQFIFYYTGSNNITLFLLPSFLYMIGYLEYTIIVSHNEWGLKFFDLNWYSDPSKIAQSINIFDIEFYNEAVLTFLYGGNYGNTSLDLSGVMFTVCFITAIIGLVFLFLLKNDKLSGMLFLASGILSLLSFMLLWINMIDNPWLGGIFDADFLPIPIGGIIFLITGYLLMKS